MPEGKRAGLEPALRKLFRENAESMPTLYSRPNDSPRSSSRRFCHHIHFHSFAAQPGETGILDEKDYEKPGTAIPQPCQCQPHHPIDSVDTN